MAPYAAIARPVQPPPSRQCRGTSHGNDDGGASRRWRHPWRRAASRRVSSDAPRADRRADARLAEQTYAFFDAFAKQTSVRPAEPRRCSWPAAAAADSKKAIGGVGARRRADSTFGNLQRPDLVGSRVLDLRACNFVLDEADALLDGEQHRRP